MRTSLARDTNVTVAGGRIFRRKKNTSEEMEGRYAFARIGDCCLHG